MNDRNESWAIFGRVAAAAIVITTLFFVIDWSAGVSRDIKRLEHELNDVKCPQPIQRWDRFLDERK